jgi:hypothetical protein
MNEQRPRYDCAGPSLAPGIGALPDAVCLPRSLPDVHPLASGVRRALFGAGVGLTLSNLVIAQAPPDEQIEEVLVTTRQTER